MAEELFVAVVVYRHASMPGVIYSYGFSVTLFFIKSTALAGKRTLPRRHLNAVRQQGQRLGRSSALPEMQPASLLGAMI